MSDFMDAIRKFLLTKVQVSKVGDPPGLNPITKNLSPKNVIEKVKVSNMYTLVDSYELLCFCTIRFPLSSSDIIVIQKVPNESESKCSVGGAYMT